MNKEIICNKCGRKIETVNNIPREDFLQVKKDWGYFSGKDGRTHSFVLCENCYDRFIGELLIEPQASDTTELL